MASVETFGFTEPELGASTCHGPNRKLQRIAVVQGAARPFSVRSAPA
jgi:hypothetical protein